MQPMARTSVSLLLLALLLCTTANSSLAALMVGGATAAAQAQPTGEGECVALQGLDVTTIDEAPAKVSAAAAVPAEEGAAAYCRVTGYVWPQVKFELRLPIASAWNGNFYFAGCGGFCGTMDGNACTPGLERGYAAATTDAGHSSIGFDGLWAWNTPQAQADLGYRGVHVATLATKAITEAYYGRPIRHAYFQGCSNGGRQGVMEAVRYPADFDGIIAGAPLLQRPERDVIEGLWMTRANRDPATGARLLSAADVPLIHEAVLHACDGLDGLVDGIIDDPRACHFDPATLQCPADGAASGCLSAAQVDALRLIYSPPRNSAGEPLYASGMVFGSEPQWPTWVTGTDTAPSLREVGSREALRYMAFEEAPGPSYDPASFDFDSDPPLLVPLASISNPDGPEALRTFQARGGKLLMWHGLADGAISPIQTIQYYTRAMEVLGGQARTQDFFRLFLFPGMFHCSGGYGPNQFDALTALEQWVEQGRAPDRVVALRVTNGTVDQTRPVFPYPLVARYIGTGSPDDAANFVPTSAGRQ